MGLPNRIIKESIRTSDDIEKLSWFEEVLFYRLIVSCDDYGRFDGRSAIIKGTCFPLKSIAVKDIEKALDKLSAVGLAYQYEVDGKPYLQLTAWEKHQTVRAKKSKYPSADEGMIKTSASKCKHMQADVHVFENPNPNPNPIRETKTYTGDARLDAALEDYIESRKKLKKPMTNRAIELAIKKLDKLSTDVDEKIEIVNKSVQCGWTDLYPLKENKSKKQGSINWDEV